MEKKRLSVEITEPDFGAFLNWLHFGEATLTFPQTIVLRYGRFERPERQLPQATMDYKRWFLGRLKTLAPLLTGAPGICAGRFTMADISIGYALLLAEYIGLAPDFPDAVGEYLSQLKQRKAFKKAQEMETAAAVAQNVSTVPAPLTTP
jgi:glutathione S-transferase